MACKRHKSGPVFPSGRKIQRGGKAAGSAIKPVTLFLACILLGLSSPSVCGAQQQKKESQAEFLVARNQIQDPFFRHSVVFMLPEQNGPLIVGLIINRPTRVTLNKLFPDLPEFKDHTEPAYFGGPVDVRTPSVVFRSSTAPERAVQLYNNIYLTFDHDLITKLFQNTQKAGMPRMFLGRAQWAPGQLQNEIRMGGWYRIRADYNLIFTSHPDDIWRTLHDRAAPSKYIRYRVPPGSSQPAPGKASVM